MSFASTPSPNWPPSPLTQRLRRIPAPDSARVLNELRLHVLVNLVGHTAGSRHVLTQWQPAPVQALHYGYPATSALPAMGYMQVTPPPSRRFPCPFRSRRGRPLPLSFIIHGADGPAPLVHTSRSHLSCTGRSRLGAAGLHSRLHRAPRLLSTLPLCGGARLALPPRPARHRARAPVARRPARSRRRRHLRKALRTRARPLRCPRRRFRPVQLQPAVQDGPRDV